MQDASSLVQLDNTNSTLTCVLLDSPDLFGSVLPLLNLLPGLLNLVRKSILQNEKQVLQATLMPTASCAVYLLALKLSSKHCLQHPR